MFLELLFTVNHGTGREAFLQRGLSAHPNSSSTAVPFLMGTALGDALQLPQERQRELSITSHWESAQICTMCTAFHCHLQRTSNQSPFS